MPQPRVLIIGCGYLGVRIAQVCLQNQIKVAGTTRSSYRAQELEKAGIEPVIFDAAHSSALTRLMPYDYVVISIAASSGLDEAYEQTYEVGVSSIVRQLKSIPPKKILYTSSIGVYDERGGAWIDEGTPISINSTRQKSLVAAEQAVLSAHFPSVVERLGGIYGPGRNRIEAIRNGHYLDHSDGYINLIHVDDAAQLSFFLLMHGSSQGIFIAVDSKPVRRVDLNRWIAKRLGVDVPKTIDGVGKQTKSDQNKRCSNKRVVDLGYLFRFPSYQEGYADLIKGGIYNEIKP